MELSLSIRCDLFFLETRLTQKSHLFLKWIFSTKIALFSPKWIFSIHNILTIYWQNGPIIRHNSIVLVMMIGHSESKIALYMIFQKVK